MKSITLKYLSLTLCVVLCLVFVFAMTFTKPVYAAEADNEIVLDELTSDPDFNPEDYPDNPEDFSLKVIQIGEDEDKNLYLYVYQPAHQRIDLLGTKVSISYGYSLNGAGLTPQLYDLELVSTSGVFDKYIVKDFPVSTDGDRYYNIVEIFREADSLIDEVDETFPETDIAYSVGQQWFVCDLNDGKYYEMNTFNTLPVETVFGGNLTFKDGLTWGDLISRQEPTDCWFYCFNVEDYVIYHIFDADLNYSIRDVVDTFAGGSHSYTYSNEREDLTVTLSDTDKMSHVGVGLGAKNFEWNRILSSEEFLETVEEQGVEVTASQREKIESSQWVFTFLETDRTEEISGSVGAVIQYFHYSDVYDVGLLRLHFQDFSGKYYDLGVVNSLSDPDNIADGYGKTDFDDFWEYFLKIITLILGVVLLAVLLHFITPLMTLLKFIFRAIVYVIALPFRILKSLFKKDG